ncbi:MAG TPA: glycosyltransferase family 9 protein [Alphaproteobacteria bacterium]|nr:glycosyltransferase family 9 protein [Alphaproteobacteria bacterium]
MTEILVIKLGALGDFVQALGPFAAIRRHHAGDRVTLLTTPPFADLACASGYFDAVETCGRPRALDLKNWARLLSVLNAGYRRVYDLQTSDRSSFYHSLIGFPFSRAPEWSGIAVGASHRHAEPKRDFMHTIDRQRDQLAHAGIADVPLPDVTWAKADIARFDITAPYLLMVPGGSAHRPEKRWPAERFAALARRLVAAGITPVLLGAGVEAALLGAIAEAAPGARNLVGRTSFVEIVALAREARAAVGNDTGPLHLIAASGIPVVALFSASSDPALCAPRGPQGEATVTVLRADSLADLAEATVASALDLV